MPSARATEIAELLYELKKAGKVTKYTVIARRAGFSPGAGGRTIVTTLTAVRKDWPHLQWWRAIPDDGVVEKDSDLHKALVANGFEVDESDKKVSVSGFEDLQMVWPEPEVSEADAAAAAAAAATPAKK